LPGYLELLSLKEQEHMERNQPPVHKKRKRKFKQRVKNVKMSNISLEKLQQILVSATYLICKRAYGSGSSLICGRIRLLQPANLYSKSLKYCRKQDVKRMDIA